MQPNLTRGYLPWRKIQTFPRHRVKTPTRPLLAAAPKLRPKHLQRVHLKRRLNLPRKVAPTIRRRAAPTTPHKRLRKAAPKPPRNDLNAGVRRHSFVLKRRGNPALSCFGRTQASLKRAIRRQNAGIQHAPTASFAGAPSVSCDTIGPSSLRTHTRRWFRPSRIPLARLRTG